MNKELFLEGHRKSVDNKFMDIITLIYSLKKTETSNFSKMDALQKIYYLMVEMIIQGKYEDLTESLNNLRDPELAKNEEVEFVRRLITVRLSMKRGDPGDNISWLKLDKHKDSWIFAERMLVEGHWNYYLQLYDVGIQCFLEAEKCFKNLKMDSREFVSAFNAIIGEISGPKNLAPQDQLEKLRSLELKVLSHLDKPDCSRVLAMIYRQKAHAFEDLNRLHASLEEISKAIPIFELNGPLSDYHLALLHAADICLDLDNQFKAKSFFEYVISPVDVRVEFPLAFIKWRLGGLIPDKIFFSILPGGWIDKFEKLSLGVAGQIVISEWKWDLITGDLINPSSSKTINIKLASLEGRLLKMLSQERATKNLLIETLWPEQNEAHLLDNRLHRLISRLNKKIDESVIYDGKYYTLQIKLQLATN